jgi:hypothetical protein
MWDGLEVAMVSQLLLEEEKEPNKGRSTKSPHRPSPTPHNPQIVHLKAPAYSAHSITPPPRCASIPRPCRSLPVLLLPMRNESTLSAGGRRWMSQY